MSVAVAARRMTVKDSWTGVGGAGVIGTFPFGMSVEEEVAESTGAAERLAERLKREEEVLRCRLQDRLAGIFGEDVRSEVAGMSIDEDLEFCTI